MKKHKPCPFCGSINIHIYLSDIDGWFKDITVECECGCHLTTNINKEPFYCENRMNEFEDTWKNKIINKWNKRNE